MDNPRRLVRLPVLPSWEKLLTRLSVLPETEVDHRSLRIEIISLISDDRNSISWLLPRLCAFLPRISACAGVAVWTKGADDFSVVATNLSPRKAVSCVEPKSVQATGKVGHHFFNKRFPVQLTANRTALTYFHSFNLGDVDGRQHYLTTFSGGPLSTETLHALNVISQAIGLRLKNHALNQNIRHQSLKLNNLTQQLGEGMAMLDRDLKVTLWNRAFQRLTGYKSSEAIGQPVDQVLRRTENADWLGELLMKCSTSDLRHTRIEFEILTKDNEKRWLNCLVSVYRNESDEIDQIAVIARDISHRRILEQKKNEFISIATHELRTPLTAIKGYLSLLERGQENLTAKQVNYLSQATKASNRLVRLAEDLLRVTQIEQDRLQFKPRQIHLFPLLKKIVRDFKPKAAAKGVTLSLTHQPIRDTVRLDPERTEQIFANLIDNAAKYTEQGAIKVWLENTEDRNGQNPRLVVNIRDTGIGVDTKNIEEIFEKFHRAHRPEQSREQGAGLGLYIVKSFVEKQNGKITVKSRAGKGSHFIIDFPQELTRRSKK